MQKIATNGINGQTALATLTDQTHALCELTAELAHEVAALKRMPAHNGGLDLRASRITPDELLDAWVAARGPKSEAYLLDRIYKRRAARRIAL
jgi:hypothetical protein